jgi:hypothetical protein
VLVSTAYAELGDVERAIREVVVDPHPLLRESLEGHFADLADRAGKRNELRQANRYLIEYLFVAIANRSGNRDPESLRLVREFQKQASEAARRYDREREDMRWMITGGLAALDAGREDLCDGYAAMAQKFGARLTDWQRHLLGDQLDRLRTRPAWAPLLTN